MRNPIRQSVAGLAALLFSCFLVSLAAQGTGPSVQLSSPALSFGNQIVGTSSAPLTELVTVQSTSAAGVTFGNVTLSGPNAADFSVQSDTCSGQNFFAGSCQITIVFHPSAAGNRSASVSINDTASGSPQVFIARGAGIPLALTSVAITPSSPSVVSGSQIQLTAQGVYNDGSRKDITKTAAWISSDSRVATVSQGLATGLRSGWSILTAAQSGVEGRTTLAVEYQLLFTLQPQTTSVGKAISPGVRVQVRNNGSPVPFTPVIIDLGPNPPNPAVLSGDRVRFTGVDGTVTFDDLKLDYLGNGYTLLASALSFGGPSSAISVPFNETRVGDPCLGPNPACSSGCPDSDGDGLNDAWEKAGGIDLNGDGRVDEKYDLMLRGADPHKQDVFVQYDWMGYSAPGNACNTSSDCEIRGSAHAGESCAGPKVLPSANGSCIYACTSDISCTSRGPGHAQEKCRANACVHTHDPDVMAPGALQAVADSYMAHGINLHLIRGHELPHSEVVSYRAAGQITEVCEGAAPTAVGLGKYAVSLYDLKAVSSLDPLKIAYHYSLFSHYSACDSKEHCDACPAAGNPDGTYKGSPPQFGQTGEAEVSGNDFVVSLGGREVDLSFAGSTLSEGSTFMHELGHNLGLRHGGGIDTPCKTNADCQNGSCTTTPVGNLCLQGDDTNSKPNYLSVMNYRYQFTGITFAGSAGSSLAVGNRLDYSNQVLPAGGNTPGYLDQSALPNSPLPGDPGLGLNESAGLGSGSADIFTFTDARETGIPRSAASTGPVDWNGDGGFSSLNVQADTNCGPAGFGDHDCHQPQYSQLKGHADWGPGGRNTFTYNFQCTPFGGPQGDGASTALFVQHEMSTQTAIEAHVAVPSRSIRIAIRPGCSGKTIAPGQPDTISVALLGSNDFDVREVELASLEFHGAQLVGSTIQDIDGDGKPDLLATFELRKMKLHPSATSARLSGLLKNSQVFIGEDAVTVVSTIASASCR